MPEMYDLSVGAGVVVLALCLVLVFRYNIFGQLMSKVEWLEGD